METIDLALLALRVFFGVTMIAHGANKLFGPGGLSGTTAWFDSIGMRWPRWQARLAATTEVGAGGLLVLGLATPLAAAGFIGLMVVAIVVAHWANGFFIFKPGQGWEYCASIAVVAAALGTVGPGKVSIDRLINGDDFTYYSGWTGMLITLVLGIGGAVTQLAISYRPPATT